MTFYHGELNLTYQHPGIPETDIVSYIQYAFFTQAVYL